MYFYVYNAKFLVLKFCNNTDKSVIMMENTKQLLEKYYEVLAMQEFNPNDLDYSIANKHISILEHLDVIDSSAISIFDLYKKDHIYVSKKYYTLYGWETDEVLNDSLYLTNRMHPDDFNELLRAGTYFLKLGYELEPQYKKDYKYIVEYRVLNKEGKYIRIIEQQMALEIDKKNNIWLALSLLDLSPEQDIEAPFKCRVLNFKTGDLYKFPPENLDKKVLSTREIQILQCIADGLISKQIADKLFISVNTVNTHRQRIIEKLNVSNTFEAIKYMNEHGFDKL